MSQCEHDEFEPSVEDDAVPGGALWGAACVAVFVIVVSVLVADGLLHVWARGRTPLYAAQPPAAPPELGIVEQTLILETRRGLDERAAQRESLRHYGWADANHRLAKIPIERAMDLAADSNFVRRAFGTPDGGH
jgi:hypothetical protein